MGCGKYTFLFYKKYIYIVNFLQDKDTLQFLLWSNHTKNDHLSVKTVDTILKRPDLLISTTCIISWSVKLDRFSWPRLQTQWWTTGRDTVIFRDSDGVASRFCYSRALMTSTNSGFREAPPTRKPSTSPWDASSLQLAPVTEPGRRREGRIWWIMWNLRENIERWAQRSQAQATTNCLDHRMEEAY